MTTYDSIAKALNARLAELTRRVGEIDSELRKPLSADFSEQAAELENQDALGAIENSELQEIRQIQEALRRIADGTYGTCANCGEAIAPKRLEALPTAVTCIACASKGEQR
jgi:RNA polymerase-binding protein DksA